jgi:uncharacterized membrane protein
MTRKWAALSASALALVLMAATFDAAEAGRRGGGFRIGGGHSFAPRAFSGRSFGPSRFVGRPRFAGPGHFRHHHRHRHIGRGFAIGVPLAYGAYAYSYGSGCRWLRYRAIETDSPYWWARYYDCINGYY